MPTKLLLAEDNEDNYVMLTRRLEQRGYEVVLAVNGQQAVDKARRQRPDLILMDIRLPQLDGYEATRQIRTSGAGSDVPIIALTAHALEEDESKARAAGCDDYHAKPVFFKQLLQQIEALLENPTEEEAT